MPLISESIESLLGGVSQQPDLSRDPSQGAVQVNGLSDKARGLMKRPPTEHAAIISTSPASWPSAFAHVISRDLKERYRVLATDGDLKVFDARTNELLPVEFPDGKGYLAIDGEADAAYRAVTVGDSTYLVNRNIAVSAATASSDAPVNHALVVIRQADFDTTYRVYIGGVEVPYSTPAGTSATVRNQISTEAIADALMTKLVVAFPLFTFTRTGSAVLIVPNDGLPFTITADDGLADDAILLITDSIQRFADLPLKAPEGYIVEVKGDPSNAFDNYWVKYTNGAWLECPKPSELISLDAATMPHELVRGGSHLDNVLSSGGPRAPRIGGATSGYSSSWWSLTKDGTLLDVLPGGVTYPSANTGAWFYADLPDADGLTYITLKYDLRAKNYSPSNTFTVTLEYYNGATWVALDTKTHNGGQDVKDVGFSTSVTLAAFGDIRVKVTGGATLESGITLYALTYHSANNTAPAFDATSIYPMGVPLTLTVDAVDFVHTPTADETGIEVAVAFAALINAHASFSATAVGEGIVHVSAVSGTSPTITYSTTWSTTTMCHLPGTSMVTSTLVGTTIRNLSDGSSGVVTANTQTTLTVSAMTGGNDNLFTDGDIISVEGDSTTFVFRQVAWDDRETGSLTLTPWPSFVGRTINEVFYFRGRLGLCAGDSVVLSEAGNTKNFFRTTITQVLDSDPIDARSTAPQGAVWHSAVNLDGAQFLFTERDQFVISGEPALTPKTIKIDLVTSFESVPNLRPIVAGRRVFFPLSHRGASQMMEYQAMSTRQGTFYDGELVTKHVPKYILGSVRQMALSPELGLLVVIADDTTNPTALIYGAAYLTAGDIPPAPAPDATLLDGFFDYLFLTESDEAADVSVAVSDAAEDTDTLALADDVVEAGAAHPDHTFADSLSLTEAETVVDYDTAGPPEITAASVSAYSNYGPGAAPKYLNLPGSVKFTFTEAHAESVKVQFKDYADTLINTEIVDTVLAGGTYLSTLFDSSVGETTYKAVITPYSGDGATGTAGTSVTVLTQTMRVFV